MDIGRLDVCLRVKDVKVSLAFYRGLGFKRVEGDDAEGWAVLINGEARIGLFEARFMGENAFTLNFRGGDIRVIAADLDAKGYRFDKGPKLGIAGSGSATLIDPDGHTIFFDTTPDEARKR